MLLGPGIAVCICGPIGSSAKKGAPIGEVSNWTEAAAAAAARGSDLVAMRRTWLGLRARRVKGVSCLDALNIEAMVKGGQKCVVFNNPTPGSVVLRYGAGAVVMTGKNGSSSSVVSRVLSNS